ncbi:MAG: site-specific integrase [Elusimicrobia bacterium]|nr:site-specific integrase [Elusimicrobiota bacterium]
MKSNTWAYMLNILKAEFGNRKIGSIAVSDLQAYYNKKRDETSNTTANRYLGFLSAIFNRAKAWGDFYGENPCSRVQKGREGNHRLRFLSLEEMERLLSVAHSRLYPVVVCAMLTGMRRGEILGLCWENISLSQDTLYILESKSGKPRELPIPGKLREVLLSIGPKETGPVFHLPVIMLRRLFAKALTDAGIFDFRFHDLRHTFASHFLMRTNDLPALQKLLGHSTPTMTQRYAHLSRGHMASNMAAFEAVIPVKTPKTMLDGHHSGHHLNPPQARLEENTLKSIVELKNCGA